MGDSEIRSVALNYNYRFPAQNLIFMLRPEFQRLQKEGATQLCQMSSDQETVIVQIYNIALSKKGKATCFVSDGHHCLKAFIQEENVINSEKHQNAILRIKNHIVSDSGDRIGIVNCDVVCEYASLIGSPVPLNETSSLNPEQAKSFQIDPKLIKIKYLNIFQEQSKPHTESNNIKSMKEEFKEERKEERKEMRVPDAKPLNGSVKDYETIKGLFVGLKNWHLLCRISKLDFNEFQKKNSDKMVRVLNIELMDRSDVKISGAFFYDAADKFKDYLKMGSVYKISEGTITNETYNNTKNDKMSPFKLMFHTNSIFEEVSDVHIIAKSEDSAITLDQILIKGIFDQEYDIIGILAEIEDPKEINKGDKTLTRWNWVIADPTQEKKIHAIVWNDKIKADYSLVGKTVLLSRFTLHNYNGSLTLNSKVRSSIQLATYPEYQLAEDKVMNEYKNYELVSQRRVKEEDTQGTVFKNMRELGGAIETMNDGETLRSDLNVLVNRITTKKWYYEGCPGCNKSAEKGTSCHCGKYVEQTVPHFIVGVQLSDHSGSLYSTAYDEQAKRIFWDEEGVIHKLMKFDEKQLKDVVEDYYYQEFKLRMYTKKDQEGRIKHNMGKLEHIIPEKSAMENVQKIREMMGLHL